MRRRFTSAMTLWKARNWRRSSGWATAAAMVPRTRAGEGDRGRLRVGAGSWSHQPRFISIAVDATRTSAAMSRGSAPTSRTRAPRPPPTQTLTVDRSGRPLHRGQMTAAALDRLLAVLVAALAVTGLVSLRMGAAADAWLFAVHGLLAAALAITVGWKVLHSLPKAVAARRWRRVLLGSILSLATCAALVGGFAWVAGGRLLAIGAWTVLTIHAWIGLFLIPLAVVHLLPRRWRLLVPRPKPAAARPTGRMVSRRRLLVAASIGAA